MAEPKVVRRDTPADAEIKLLLAEVREGLDDKAKSHTIKLSSSVEEKLTVELAFSQASEDCREIRTRLSLTDPIFTFETRENLLLIETEAKKILAEKDRSYDHYEIGHIFIVDHILASAKKEIGITTDEEELLRAAVRRIYYNPPEREYLRSAEAAEKLFALGERGQQIFDVCTHEASEFIVNLLNGVHLVTDMFNNPKWGGFGYAGDNFHDMADHHRDMIKFLEENEAYQETWYV